MLTENQISKLLKFMHLRRPRKRETTVPTVKYSETGYPTPNFYDTIKNMDLEYQTYENIKMEAQSFAGTSSYIGDKEKLEITIPNLFKLMEKIKERGDSNTAETFWNDVNGILGQPPADYVIGASYTINLSLLWDNIMAELFLEISSKWMEKLCNALVILNLIKKQVDDWNTSIVSHSKSQVLIPDWLYSIYAKPKGKDDDSVGKPNANNQAYQNAISDIYAWRDALSDLQEAVVFITKTGQISKDYLETNTQTRLQMVGVLDDNGYFSYENGVYKLKKQLGKEIAKFPTAAKRQSYTVVKRGMVIKSEKFCGDNSTPPNPCDQDPILDFKFGDTHYTRKFFGDLMVTHQYLFKYEKGEIAHVEAVMKNLKKVRTHRRLNRTETTFSTETENSIERERETQTTDRFSLEKETSRVVSQEMSLDTGVNISGDFGIVAMEASLGFSFSNTSTQSSQEATSFSREITSRALDKVKQSVRESKSVTIIQETEETSENTVDNAPNDFGQPTDHINGVYRWLDKIYLNKMVVYKNR